MIIIIVKATRQYWNNSILCLLTRFQLTISVCGNIAALYLFLGVIFKQINKKQTFENYFLLGPWLDNFPHKQIATEKNSIQRNKNAKKMKKLPKLILVGFFFTKFIFSRLCPAFLCRRFFDKSFRNVVCFIMWTTKI